MSEPGEVVLRMAMAMAGAVTGPIPWEKMPPDSRAIYLRDARLALEAIREPTEAMLLKGVRAFQTGYSPTDTLADWREMWRAMVDEALR